MSLPELRVVLADQLLDLTSAIKQGQRDTTEAFLWGLVLIPLEDRHLIRIHLVNHFRHAIQSSRKRRPHNIVPIVSSAKKPDEKSVEAKIFKAGGTRALVAYASAAQGNRDVVNLIKSLDDNDLEAFLKSTAVIEAHKSFSHIVHIADYEEPRESGVVQHVPGPRDWKRRRSNTSQSSHDGNVARKRPLQQIRRSLAASRSSEEPVQHRPPQGKETQSCTVSARFRPTPGKIPYQQGTTACGDPEPWTESALPSSHQDDPQLGTAATAVKATKCGPQNSSLSGVGGLTERLGRQPTDHLVACGSLGNQRPPKAGSGGTHATSHQDVWNPEWSPVGFADAASTRTADFDAAFIMMSNFDGPSGFDANAGTISELNTFDAAQIMSTDFDFLLPETGLTLSTADPLAETIHVNSRGAPDTPSFDH